MQYKRVDETVVALNEMNASSAKGIRSGACSPTSRHFSSSSSAAPGGYISASRASALERVWGAHTRNRPFPGVPIGAGALTELAKAPDLYRLESTTVRRYEKGLVNILSSADEPRKLAPLGEVSVSYTHLTLPTI